MKTRKLLLTLLFCVMLIAALLPTAANAAEVASGSCGENAVWSLDENGTLTISGQGKMEWSADPWLSYKSQIKKIVICPGITEIKHGAFIYLSSVTDVSIPDSVTKIGGYAFAECNGLTSIRLPDTVTEIDSYAFSRCQNLSSITLPKNLKTIGDYVFTDSLSEISPFVAAKR